MTDCFRVYNLPDFPLIQIPPQKGFPTVQPASDRISLKTMKGTRVGSLYPVHNYEADAYLFEAISDDTPVCVIADSNSPNSKFYKISDRKFPNPCITSFLCDVSYGVEVGDLKLETVVSGPRMVEVSKSYMTDDGFRAVDLEIIEMYLAGYARNGVMITVRGGKNFGLPPIPGQAKSVAKEHDFPANLYFDLTLEITYWGEV